MPRPIKPVPPQPLTPRQEVASRISAGIFAGPAGRDLLDTEDDEPLHAIKRVAYRYADIFFAVEAQS